jgi:hypothetical protein
LKRFNKRYAFHAMRPEVGVVGAKLMYPDNSIQHAGIVIGPNGYAVEVFNGYKVADNDYMLRAAVRCDYSAVTWSMPDDQENALG